LLNYPKSAEAFYSLACHKASENADPVQSSLTLFKSIAFAILS